jgi:hypothetical protein
MKERRPAYMFEDTLTNIMPIRQGVADVLEDMSRGMRAEKEAAEAPNLLYPLIMLSMIAAFAPFAPLILWEAIRPKK